MKEIFIDSEEIEEYFFNKLIREGFVPSEEEVETIADIVFDYLIHKQIIDEELS